MTAEVATPGACSGIERGVIGVGRGVDLQHVDDDHRGVVLAARGVGRGDERVGEPLRIGFGAGQALDVALAHHRGEAVGAEHDAVAGFDVDRVQVDVDALVDPERAR